jgi:hypothetical protein
VKLNVYGKCNFSRTKPRSSGEVVRKNRENADMRTRNLRVIDKEKVSVDPVKKFIINIRVARTAPPLKLFDHRRRDLAK